MKSEEAELNKWKRGDQTSSTKRDIFSTLCRGDTRVVRLDGSMHGFGLWEAMGTLAIWREAFSTTIYLVTPMDILR